MAAGMAFREHASTLRTCVLVLVCGRDQSLYTTHAHMVVLSSCQAI